jgi:SAM-dependent methyltransferase
MSKNIAYRTDKIARFYGEHRRRWQELYPSERWMFERVVKDNGRLGAVLDVGCAAGGLGEAFAERFDTLQSYTGVEINEQAVEVARASARRMRVPTEFSAADICNWQPKSGQRFDLVTALSVVDWNVEADDILAACWDHVAPSGHLVVSLRLTPKAGTCDIERSFQYIWFDPPPIPEDAERAAYHVFNTHEALLWLAGQNPKPERVFVYGYWGMVSPSARTPYDRLVFSVVALRKARAGHRIVEPCIETHLPDDAMITPD